MIRQTSIDALHKIIKEDLLSKLRLEVYQALYNSGPMTAQETWHYIRNERAKLGDARINGITPRFSELNRLGVINEVDKRACKITGYNCIVWDVNDKLPTKPEKKKSKDQIIKELQEEITQLKLKLDIYEW